MIGYNSKAKKGTPIIQQFNKENNFDSFFTELRFLLINWAVIVQPNKILMYHCQQIKMNMYNRDHIHVIFVAEDFGKNQT